MLASFFVAAALALGVVALPEASLGSAEVIYNCKVPNTAALTFDDGPHEHTYHIVNTLEAAGAKGTFFFNGDNMGCIYSHENRKRVKHAFYKGHQVASHTWRHADLSKLSWDEVHDEMWRVEQALQRIVGVTPAFMRPPYGSHNGLVRKVAHMRGQRIALWDLE
ncbi:hypothetical protein HGRIS_004470 [Hohenbuehelia grisea]|uniref:NodB homology domain-containing protein n=1 Tax=Hohenbuehelia grisea TaxID=104357 RepID=A0ABR3JC80_9AGAR